MSKFFKFKEMGTNYRIEFMAGLTTFLAMAYILFVNRLHLRWTALRLFLKESPGLIREPYSQLQP